MSLKEKVLSLPKYNIVASFLALEVIAFIAFSFGGSFVLYGALSLALFIVLILFSIKEIKADGISNIIILIFPLFLFTVLTALGSYMRAHVMLGDYTLAEDIFVPVGIISVALCGYLLSLNKTFKIKTFLIIIFSALAILVVINLFINIINFGPFYTFIYKGYYMYYGGKRSSLPINDMAYTLEGFKFIEVKISHYALYPTILLSCAFMLLIKTSPRNERKTFIIYSLFVLVALLALIFVPSIYSIIAVVFNGAITGVMFVYRKLERVRYPLMLTMVAVIGFGSLLFIVMLLNNQSFASGFHKFIANNYLLNRIFNTNSIVSSFNVMVQDVLGKYFLGYAAHQVTEVIYEEMHLSGSFFFDTFMTSGVIGVIALSFFLIMGLKGFKDYFNCSEEEEKNKAVLLNYILVLYAYSFFFYQGEYGIFYSIYKPFYMTGPFIISVFIFVYTMSKGKIDKASLKEANNNEVAA